MDQSGRKRPKEDGPRPALRGNAVVTVDDSGRLKLPAAFRRDIEAGWGRELYLTSLTGENLWIYPLAVWRGREERILAAARRHPAVDRLIARTSYFGAEETLDGQGRVIVPPVLRGRARMSGEVALLGALDHLEAWNNAVFLARLEAEPLSADDLRALAELGL